MIDRLCEVVARDVSRETFDRMCRFVDLLLAANETQNLIAKSSIDSIWERHILDSAQLERFLPTRGTLLDIGSGAGLPGIVLAILRNSQVTLVEPRALRASFLTETAQALALDNVRVVHGKAAHATGRHDAITARAVAPASDLFKLTLHLAHAGTLFVFPKGRSATSELEVAQGAWQGDFRLEPSATSDEASILVASRVRPRGKG